MGQTDKNTLGTEFQVDIAGDMAEIEKNVEQQNAEDKEEMDLIHIREMMSFNNHLGSYCLPQIGTSFLHDSNTNFLCDSKHGSHKEREETIQSLTTLTAVSGTSINQNEFIHFRSIL